MTNLTDTSSSSDSSETNNNREYLENERRAERNHARALKAAKTRRKNQRRAKRSAENQQIREVIRTCLRGAAIGLVLAATFIFVIWFLMILTFPRTITNERVLDSSALSCRLDYKFQTKPASDREIFAEAPYPYNLDFRVNNPADSNIGPVLPFVATIEASGDHEYCVADFVAKGYGDSATVYFYDESAKQFRQDSIAINYQDKLIVRGYLSVNDLDTSKLSSTYFALSTSVAWRADDGKIVNSYEDDELAVLYQLVYRNERIELAEVGFETGHLTNIQFKIPSSNSNTEVIRLRR